jgi:hypothetical protein
MIHPVKVPARGERSHRATLPARRPVLLGLAVALAATAAPAAAHDTIVSPGDGELTPAQFALFGKPFQLPPNPEVTGSWDFPIYFPEQGTCAAVLPTGKVLFFGKRGYVIALLFDPVTKDLIDVSPPGEWNPTCSGHLMMPDGRLLVFGGIHKVDSLIAHQETYYFDPFTEEWGQVGDTKRGRYYPSGVLLADGRVVVVGGSIDVIGHGTRNKDVEVLDPLGQPIWERVAEHELDWYPLLHLLGTGQVFISGPAQLTELYDPITKTFSPVGNRVVPTRYYAPSVLLPPDNTSVAVLGGQVGSQVGPAPVTDTIEIIDFTSPTPTWQLSTPMSQGPRVNHSAVLLPDQTVLVVGGTSVGGKANAPIYTPEVFDPATATWTPLGKHRHPRIQHSTALLLPDARVIAAGRPETKSAEIYSPPYLFKGTRPVITAAPDELAYGGSFTLDFTSRTESNTVCLIRLSSVTHSVNFGQRYVLLGEHLLSQTPVSVAAPPDSAKAPAGFYMLFVVDSNGVPSVSTIVQLR